MTENVKECAASGAFDKCVDCFYFKGKGEEKGSGTCKADGRNIITGLDNKGEDIQGGK